MKNGNATAVNTILKLYCGTTASKSLRGRVYLVSHVWIISQKSEYWNNRIVFPLLVEPRRQPSGCQSFPENVVPLTASVTGPTADSPGKLPQQKHMARTSHAQRSSSGSLQGGFLLLSFQDENTGHTCVWHLEILAWVLNHCFSTVVKRVCSLLTPICMSQPSSSQWLGVQGRRGWFFSLIFSNPYLQWSAIAFLGEGCIWWWFLHLWP